jgi:hypothetical protein
MIIRYSLYERTRTGYQWTWHADELKDTLLDDFRYRIHFPDSGKDILSDHLVGGALKFSHVQAGAAQEHVVLFRFFDGGSDEGRGRVTMLTAWTTVDQFPSVSAEHGILEILKNRTFEEISKKSRKIGIEQPYSLFSNEPFPGKSNDASLAVREFVCGFNDHENDYLLTINNEVHCLKKIQSEAVKVRDAEIAQKKKVYGKPCADTLTVMHERIKQEDLETALKSEHRQDPVEDCNPESGAFVTVRKLVISKTFSQGLFRCSASSFFIAFMHRKYLRIICLFSILINVLLAYVVILPLFEDYLHGRLPKYENPEMIQQVEMLFDKLSRDDQRTLLSRLSVKGKLSRPATTVPGKLDFGESESSPLKRKGNNSSNRTSSQ